MIFSNLIKKYLSKESTGSFLKLLSGAVVVQLVAIALTPLLARLFTPEEFGLTALYLSILSILTVVSTAKYEQAIMLPHCNQDARNLFWLVQILSIGFALFILLMVVFFGEEISQVFDNAALRPWLWLLPVSIVMHGFLQGCIFYANRNKQFGIITQNTILQGGSLNAGRVVTGFMQIPINGLLLSQLLSQAIATFQICWHNRNVIFQKGNLSRHSLLGMAKVYASYPKYNLLLNFTNNLSGALPVLMFTRGFSAEAAGLFAFGYALIFKPIGFFAQSLSQVLSQKIIEQYHNNMPIFNPLHKLVKKQFSMGILPFAMLGLLAPMMFQWVFPESYHPAGIYIQILTPWFFLVYLTSSLSFLPELLKQQKKAMKIDMAYLLMRFSSLAFGIWQNDLILSLVLFSAVSTFMVGYNLHWYLKIAKQHDSKNTALQT